MGVDVIFENLRWSIKMMIMHACEIAKCDYAQQMINIVMQVIICRDCYELNE